MTGAVVVFCTCSNLDEALRIAKALVEGRFAACVNILPAVQSIYRWHGAVESSEEVLLTIKTTAERFEALRGEIIKLHSYDTPEVIAVPVIEGSKVYLDWIREQV
jgi:periplasmic divalent cation tolerance protein